jgi:small GTP-binding protein
VPALTSLDCSYNQLSDLAGLAHVLALTSLDCSANELSDLAGLAHVPALTSLDCSYNQLSDLAGLGHMPVLTSLDCRNNQLGDLAGLAHVPSLTSLNCSGNQLRDLKDLEHVPSLTSLSCGINKIHDLTPIYEAVMSGRLTNLRLYANPIAGLPNIILGSSEYDDCLESLKNYWLDLKKGSITQRQLKVQLVGNGRVGKSTLAYALEHKCASNERLKSTHGIVIKEVAQAIEGEAEPVTLQLWDFGGQEIYHATHRLFLSNDCLYLLLWAEETEESLHETRHSTGYWLESIHDLGAGSPVILIKNQIDRADHLPERPPELTDEVLGYQQIKQAVKISAFQYKNFAALRGAIEDVLQELKYRVCINLPSSWFEVQQALSAFKSQKTMPLAHFQQLCIKAGVNDAEWFVQYLHRTGILFYQQGAFQDQIILDQNWAIEAVYKLFDPHEYRPLLEQMRGRFKGRFTSNFWRDAEQNEREIYLSFMCNAGICYEVENQAATSFDAKEFIIPALLPECCEAKLAWQSGASSEDWVLEIAYTFLHRSIIERLIVGLGASYQAEPWRTGIFCRTEYGQVLVEAVYANKQQSTQGSLVFQLRGAQLKQLVYLLRQLVSEISPHRRYQEFLTQGQQAKQQLPEFQQEQDMHSALDKTQPQEKTIKLFISYSHKDEALRERLDIELKGMERSLPLKSWHDRNLLAGSQVHTEILKQLQAADIVLLLISPDFMASDYCFNKEMEIALKDYEAGRNIVIPVIVRKTADWSEHQIGQHTALPKDGKHLKQWADEDEFWADVNQGIRNCVKSLLAN